MIKNLLNVIKGYFLADKIFEGEIIEVIKNLFIVMKDSNLPNSLSETSLSKIEHIVFH